MAQYKERRTFPFSVEQIFDLVADVERYPEFLPLWHSAITRRSLQDRNLYFTQQTLQLGPVRKCFRTETRMQRPHSIRITSSDPLFDEFVIQWEMQNASSQTCTVDFLLNCEAASLFFKPIFEVVLADAAQSIVSAFERRAYTIYRR
ncbi:MAG: type II toxin-antitoxin system RatA family toxin [Gammaproteobacteria bacterium]|nr:type II toxin-antitoxin system RatA family toxin [Gammaproteobacteria bacterium]